MLIEFEDRHEQAPALAPWHSRPVTPPQADPPEEEKHGVNSSENPSATGGPFSLACGQAWE
ncbi:MAG: hypothetical protein Q7J98_10195 [Kiritimatiellia bacterium]|nr:hypothetical protein [Kiritimatiellia bacterium]